MSHIEEHILEAYALHAPEISAREEEISSHLRECPGCRQLCEEYRTFYDELHATLSDPDHRPVVCSDAVVRRSRAEIRVYHDLFGSPIRNHPATLAGRTKDLIQAHPLATGITGLCFAALAGLLILSLAPRLFRDMNPVYTHLNSSDGKLEIYNRARQEIWSIPVRGMQGASPAALEQAEHSTIVSDVDQNGRNEIVTILPIGDYIGNISPLSVLKPNEADGAKHFFRDTIRFRGTPYAEMLNPGELAAAPFGTNQTTNFFLVASNGRSPNVLYRLNERLETIGEYFHFGQIREKLFTTSAGKQLLVLYGENDLGETDSVNSAIIAVLDPSKILEKRESSASRGFNHPVSDAELFYIRFPLTDMNYLLKTKEVADELQQTTFDGKPVFTVWTHGGGMFNLDKKNGSPAFEYIFNERFELLEIKFDSETYTSREVLSSNGSIKGKIDASYLDHLRQGVSYWDGDNWQQHPVGVQHGP